MDDLSNKTEFSGDGIITFHRMEHALKAEKFLKAAGFNARMVVPPHAANAGCNLGLMFQLSKQHEIERLLREKRVDYTRIGPLEECK